MNSMVSGIDIQFEAERENFSVYRLMKVILTIWPESVFQDAEETEVQSVDAIRIETRLESSREFFVYKNQESAESWEKAGWTEAHGNDMIQFLITEDIAQPQIFLVNLVIDKATREMIVLLAAVRKALTSEPNSERNLGKNDWDQELQIAGYSSGKKLFYESVESLRKDFYPEWNTDELLCHPQSAVRFCELVQKLLAPVPDYIVMKALLNSRKQRKKNSAIPDLELLRSE